jgi:hypothetical protein
MQDKINTLKYYLGTLEITGKAVSEIKRVKDTIARLEKINGNK